jgi:cation diffusion facilitator CzcD-associated flavoprotein CzcO
MADTHQPWRPADLEGLRARYRAERDKRLRPDANAQWLRPGGALAGYSVDPWAPRAAADREPLTDEVDAAVIGAGFGGLLAGARLRKAGLGRIRLVDTAGDVGGTWYWNRYPGVACDIESYIYLPMLEEIGGMPSRKYVGGAEIRRHAEAIADRFDLRRESLFRTEVTALEWEEERQRWRVRTDRGDAFLARYVVISAGPFSRPKLPGIPGIEEFTGAAFHTSRWDYGYTGGAEGEPGLPGLADRRVAVIGTGATAIQVVPHVAEQCRELLVVQRTPSTVDRRDDRETDAEWWATLEPGWQRTRRENFLALVTGRGAEENLVGDQWTDTAPVRGVHRLRAGTGEDLPLALELADHQKMTEIRERVSEIVTDPDTAAALQPWYRQMCKRPGFSDRYLQAFNRDNVRLVDTAGHGVDRMTATGFVVAGTEYPVDLVIFATGFEAGPDPLARAGADIQGRGGLTLAEYWADGLRTLHGWVSRGFPNLIQLGSLQNAVSVNFTHVLEEQTEHVGAVVAEAERRGVLVEPTAEAESTWVDTIRARAQDTHAFLSECTPGYYNEEGRPRKRSEGFGGGPIEFTALVRAWRETGMDDVLSG